MTEMTKTDRKQLKDNSVNAEKDLSERRKPAKLPALPASERAVEYILETGVDAPIFLFEGKYYRRKKDSVYPMTNFRIEPVEMVYAEDETEITADCITAGGSRHRISLLATDFSNSQRFKSVLNRRTIELAWYGGEGDLELFKTYLSELPWPSRIGVKAMGIHRFDDQYVFVDTECTVDKHGEKIDGIVQLEKYRVIESSILDADCLSADELRVLGRCILTYNEPAKTVAVLAWCSGCFIKQHLRSAGHKFPSLMLVGEAGSGKSTTLEYMILPIFSTDNVQASTQVTAFTLMKTAASSNLVPMCMDEFKPSKMNPSRLNSMYNHCRDSYDGHTGVRGKADQSVAMYRLDAPIAIAGEESADETAIRERMIEILFSKKDIRGPEHRDAFVLICSSRELLEKLGRTLLAEALGTDDSEADIWYAEGYGMFNGELPGRVVNNLACCYAGLRLIRKICLRFSLDWEDVFPLSPEDCIKALGYGAEEYLLDGGKHNKSIVEQTFEIMSRMGLLYGEDYIISLDNKELFIRIPHIYDRFTRYRREFAVEGEVLTYSQFRKQLRHSDLLIASNVQKRLRSGNAKGYIINYELLKERADVEGFELS